MTVPMHSYAIFFSGLMAQSLLLPWFFQVKLAIHLTHSHKDGPPAPLEFNIYVFREIKAENGASFIAAIQ